MPYLVVIGFAIASIDYLCSDLRCRIITGKHRYPDEGTASESGRDTEREKQAWRERYMEGEREGSSPMMETERSS